MSIPVANVRGVGLGYRRPLVNQMLETPPAQVDFMELAPENWIGLGGRHADHLRSFTERYPFVAHGLSLSLGGPAPLDEDLLRRIKAFLDLHDIQIYTEHLSYCSDEGQLYDLMPIPFTEEAVRWVADRIRIVEEITERPFAVENVSYYASHGAEMSEIDFLNAVLAEADCGLLLDVNNIYVNSINHRYDALEFLAGIPAERVTYLHIAGHHEEAEDLRVDTHGAPIVDPVWELLETTYERLGPVPTMLERDFNFPPLQELLREVDQVHAAQAPFRDDDSGEADHGA
jgi:uncharacterized protein (UPF0276 family)